MTTWREQLRPASWRGIPFLVKTVEAKPGRRVVVHEYPGRDFADWEDLGKMPKRFRIEAFFVGNDYLNSRNRLLHAIDEQPGPGLLVLPTHGQFDCVCREVESNWNDSEGGIETLTLTMVQVGQFAATPQATNAPAVQLPATTAQAATTVAQSVGQALPITGQPSFVQVGTLTRAQGLLDTVQARFARLQLATTTALQVAGRIQAIRTQGLTLLATPANYARSVLGLFTGVGAGFGGDLRSLFNAYASLFDALGLGSGGDGEGSPVLVANQRTVTQLQQTAVLLAMADVVPQLEWPARSDAVADRTTFAERAEVLEASLSEAFVDEWLAALQPVRVLVNRAITEEARTLLDYRTVRLRETVPALVLAYELYADAFRADDIVAENAVRHPGFLPVDSPLRVLEA